MYMVNPEVSQRWNVDSPWDNRIYSNPYSRFQTYGVGLLLGIALYDLESIKTRLQKRSFVTKFLASFWVWVLMFVLMAAVVFGCYPTANGHTMSVAASVLYNCTFRLLWGILVALMIFLCTLGYGGFINSILSSKYWVPFARVNYTTYIIHFLCLVFYMNTAEQTYRFSTVSIVLLCSGLLVCINIFSVFLSCFIEAPFIGLEKLMMGK